MFKNITHLAALALVLLLANTGIASNAQRQPPAFKITAIRAMLFYDSSGTFSKDILSDPNISLWNTIIGEGDSGGASSSTLIVVEMTGEPGAYETRRKIEFTATYRLGSKNKGLTVIKRIKETGIFNNQGKFYAAFWLYETGCAPVKLSARLIGQSQPSAMRKIINFACGE